MIPVEVMISESQERMLVIVEKGKEQEVRDIFEKWGLHSAVIGRVTDDGMLTIRENGEVVGRVPAKSLSEDAPVYHRSIGNRLTISSLKTWTWKALKPGDYNDVLVKLQRPNIASKKWAYLSRQHSWDLYRGGPRRMRR